MEIYIIGAGSFGTALANHLSFNKINNITILARNENQVREINKNHTNLKYFPNKILNNNIKATTNKNNLLKADVICVAIPSKEVKNTFDLNLSINKKTLIINFSKGIFSEGKTIVDFLNGRCKSDNIVTMKGGTFSEEIMNNLPSLFTLGYFTSEQQLIVEKIFNDTNIYIDYTNDVRGVELLSVLKNIYAILIGVADAKYNSTNTRFMILTKAFSEMKILLLSLGGNQDTLFLSSGFGDFCLTALNDLSRNRTLGLLIGKGFFNTELLSSSVVIEGVNSIKIIYDLIPANIKSRTPLLNTLHSYFENNNEVMKLDLDYLFNNKFKTVLTYGTFDLLHYGHLEILKRSKNLGDRLIVGLSTDEFNRKKGKNSIMNYKKRKELLESLSYVDLVIPENDWDQKIEDVKKHGVNLFIIGNDWENKFDYLKEFCDVVYLERTKGISTTKLKSIVND